jgi:hypothetical protein
MILTTLEQIRLLVEENGIANGNLVGIDGNALSVVCYTVQRLKKANWPHEDIKQFEKLSLNSDYNNVLACCASVLDFEEENL